MAHLKRNFNASFKIIVAGGFLSVSVWLLQRYSEMCLEWVEIVRSAHFLGGNCYTMKSGWTELTLCATSKCIFSMQRLSVDAPFLAPAPIASKVFLQSQSPKDFSCNGNKTLFATELLCSHSKAQPVTWWGLTWNCFIKGNEILLKSKAGHQNIFSGADIR